jgi:uncharacterized SAM-binding protein YcdF (DUF218 family)
LGREKRYERLAFPSLRLGGFARLILFFSPKALILDTYLPAAGRSLFSFSRKGAKPQRNLTALCLPIAIMVLKVLGTWYFVHCSWYIACLPQAGYFVQSCFF